MISNMEIIVPTQAENEVLHQLDDSYIQISEMSEEERRFLNALILRNKPKKLLEVGVSAGASSIIMLNAMKDIADSKLYSIDHSETLYRDSSFKTGYFVDKYPQLKDKYQLYCGNLAMSYMDTICGGGGGSIDFCLIDTMHCNPGEILDFLMILPYIKDNAVIVFHDVNLHTDSGEYCKCNASGGITNNLLMSSIFGKKLIQGEFVRRSRPLGWGHFQVGTTRFPNIGAIEINKETKEHIFEIFNLLTLKWAYLPKESEKDEMALFFSRYYEKYFVDYFKEVYEYHKQCIHNEKSKYKYRYWLKQTTIRFLNKYLK